MIEHEILIIGAGASGLMCAAQVQSPDIAFLEGNSKIGLKILASGGGKCNVTNKNITNSNYLADTNFINHALTNFTSNDLLEFLATFQLALETRKYGQIFCKNSAKDIVNIFANLTQKCHFYYNTLVSHVSFDKSFIIHTNAGIFKAKKLIVASGGLSYSPLGSTPIGYEIAKSFGHSLVEPSPALVGLTVQREQFWMRELSGVSFNVVLKVGDKTLEADLLFTHKGISGPVVLSGSLYWKKGKISIDFLPHVDLKKLLDRKSKKQISSLLPLPKSFIKAFLTAVGIKDEPICRLSDETMQKLLTIKNYEFAPAGNFGYSKAEVTRGGVCTDEIDAHTFESKLQKNLFFIGEVLDVTGELGGYNFQWAFASAVNCAREFKRSENANSRTD